jgi:hypothetical protein
VDWLRLVKLKPDTKKVNKMTGNILRVLAGGAWQV